MSLGALLALPAVAQADDFRVTNLSTSGSGSLKAAIDGAYENGGADRILFKSKLSGTISPTDPNEALYIGGGGGDLEIIGPGARKLTLTGQDGFPALVPWATFNGEPGADVRISGLRIANSNNDSGFFGTRGGGLQVYGDMDVTLERVTIASNRSDSDGGGIAVLPGAGTPSLAIENSTISGNENGSGGSDYGGGIYVNGTDFSLINSTVSGNIAGDDGGGIYANANSQVDIRSSTITRNIAEIEDGGGIYAAQSADLDIRGTIVADNSAGNDNFTDLRLINAGSYAFSFSLVGNPDNHTISGSTNILGVDSKLKPLKNNGGPTDTHAFKKSPAKNEGPGDAPNSDQRGAPRKGKPDIGAYELTKCEGVIVNRVGTAGKDKLKGTKRKDGILGLGGNDKLSGKKGKDGLCGGSGKDKLKGGPGVDKLDGGPGKDKEVQ